MGLKYPEQSGALQRIDVSFARIIVLRGDTDRSRWITWTHKRCAQSRDAPFSSIIRDICSPHRLEDQHSHFSFVQRGLERSSTLDLSSARINSYTRTATADCAESVPLINHFARVHQLSINCALSIARVFAALRSVALASIAPLIHSFNWAAVLRFLVPVPVACFPPNPCSTQFRILLHRARAHMQTRTPVSVSRSEAVRSSSRNSYCTFTYSIPGVVNQCATATPWAALRLIWPGRPPTYELVSNWIEWCHATRTVQ